MNKRILSVIMAALLAILPASALGGSSPEYNTPMGYNEHDYQKLVAFMDTTDENGVRNGEKIVSAFDGYYLPAFPVTWSYYYYDHENGILYMYGVFWTDDEENSRVCALELYDMDLVGRLDFEGCTEMSEVYCDLNHFKSIDASGCTELRAMTCSRSEVESISIKGCASLDLFDCSQNALTELDASGCAALTDIECSDNRLSRLDLAGCASLNWLDCFNNCLIELDLSYCPELYNLDCTGNPLKEITVPAEAPLTMEHLAAEGGGTVSFRGSIYSNETAYAEPANGCGFIGWYTDEGELITNNPALSIGSAGVSRAVARFTSPVMPGDADGNGRVNANDALAILRYSLGIDTVIDLAASDVDGDGIVNANDALMVLRAALGIITL